MSCNKKERYGKAWKHAYRIVNGKKQPVLVKKVKGKECIKVPSKAYISRHHPRGPWDLNHHLISNFIFVKK